MTRDTLLVGIGSPYGDDQIGWILADLLRDRCDDILEIRTTSVPLDLLNWIDGVRHLHIVDACDGEQEPGHLFRWNWSRNRNPKHEFGTVAGSTRSRRGLEYGESEPSLSDAFVLRGTGTHDFDVMSVFRLAEQLGQSPPCVSIWGVQTERFDDSETLSPAVRIALPSLVTTIAQELSNARTISGAISADAG